MVDPSGRGLEATIDPGAARIHDIGYSRYDGVRRPQRQRYRVIVANMLRMAWRGWWRAKLWVVGTGAAVLGVGIAMLTFREKLAPAAERMLGERAFTVPDFLLAHSFSGFVWAAFLLSMTVIAGTVARDLRAGAFEFYFSRPVRARDYLLGKLGGSLLLVGVPLLLGPMLLALFRVGLEAGNLGRVWQVIPQTLLIGSVASVVYAAVPLAFSSMARKPRDAIIMWAAYYLVLGPSFSAISLATGVSEIMVVNINGALTGVVFGFYGWEALAGTPVPPLGLSLIALFAYGAAALLVLSWRVRAIERAGIGGGS
jgi:ABC-2 type transport system permease protein